MRKRGPATDGDFAGIDAPNQPPENAEIVVPTDQQSLDESLVAILGQLLRQLRPEERAR